MCHHPQHSYRLDNPKKIVPLRKEIRRKYLLPLSIKSTSQTMMGSDTLDTVERVDILVKDNLVTSCGTLAGDDGRVGQKEFPNLQP